MKFSVVIPTRNRAEKLRHALRSALAQEFEDYEIVVSNNQSTDHTEIVVQAATHPRLRYVKAPSAMSMVDHWEFALQQAHGEWVLFLCDDDALMPGALATLSSIIQKLPKIELIQYGVINYVYDDGVSAESNYVDVPQRVSRRLQMKSSRRVLFQSFRRLSGDMPKFLNSAVHRSLINRVRHRYGRIFWDWAPDYSSASLLLACTSRFVRTGPLMLWGDNLESYGAGSARNPNHLLSFFRQFDTFDGSLSQTPYPSLLTVQNCVYDTFSRVRNLLGRPFANLWIDPIRYRRILIKDCQRYVANGYSGYEFAARHLEQDLDRLIRKRLFRPAWALHALGTGLSDLITRLLRSVAGRADGSKQRARMYFENICEAAATLGELACPVSSGGTSGSIVSHAELNPHRPVTQHVNKIASE